MTKTLTTELLSVARAMRDYIDALPSDVVASLPTMPGFDRDWADEVIEAANREAQPVQAPFMYAICNPDGSAWLDENCVAGTAEELKPVLSDLRRDTGDGFCIVHLFTAPPAPADQKCECSSIDYCDSCMRKMSAQPAPAVPDISALTDLIVDRLIDCSAADDDSIADAETFVYNACRAAMLNGGKS
ncbi:hypothetical protein [Serratia proteamaculans]|uniref:hypothetical protein n=1 Tax=Serratia proteamaculans TaxID=28151 RepID=UPI001021A1C6|nr:hypothetical protein [Serratia proteamaculans]RYM48747.1 hypothetical protein BSQ97_20905 [Serratia proteamaculans]